MRILTRYVFREFIIPFGYCLGGFLSIYILFELFGSFARLASAQLPWLMVVDYFCAYLAPFFHYLAPAALMLAALYTMWNFCRHSEIIAMRANGISFSTIVKPILTVTIIVAGFVFWLGETYIPNRAQWARHMKSEKFNLDLIAKAENIVFRNSRQGRTWTIGKILDSDANHLENVKVTIDRDGGGMRLMNITAPKADYLDGEWWFINPRVIHYDIVGRETPSTTPDLDALTLRSFPQFNEIPSDFLMQNRDWSFSSVRDRLRYLKDHKELDQELRRKYTYDTWSKIMAPFACIVITLFAIPAGIASGRQSVFKGVLGALGMFFSFYALSIGCMIFANLGWLPAIFAAVLPIVVFLILGIRAFYKQR